MTDWARNYFEHGYTQRWDLGRPSESTRREIDFLWDELLLEPKARIADIASGHGKYACALALRGARVVGVDFMLNLLERARQIAIETRASVFWADEIGRASCRERV